MTAQEIYERDGFLIAASPQPYPIGSVLTPVDGVAAGASVVIISEASVKDARKQAIASRQQWPPAYGIQPYHYKVIAE